jgi:hypothetical protein
MRKQIIFHPILFALFPALSLLSNNIHQVEIVDSIRSLMISIGIALLILGIFYLIFRDIYKSAIITSFIIILFFSYGHIYDSLKVWFPDHASLIRHRYLLPISGFLILTWFFYVWKRLNETVVLNHAANLIALILCIFPLFTIVKAEISTVSLLHDEEPSGQFLGNIQATDADGDFPDIYYIILDGYGRSDILQDLYGCDNSDFISDLQSLGFYIATQSTSNYNQTILSLASSLNMEYINYLSEVIGENRKGIDVPIEMLHHNEVRRILKELGYEFISFPSNYYPTEIFDADIYWTSGGLPIISETHAMLYGWSLNNFESLLATTTIVRAFIDFNLAGQNRLRDQIISYQYTKHINAIYHTLFSLDEVANLDGQFLIFAHIVSPHPPFVFGPNGEQVITNQPYFIGDGSDYKGSEEEYKNGYCNQMKYINKLVLVSISRILAKSDPEPIIIIQGDHGPGAFLEWDSAEESNLPERMSILNAYLLPGTDEDLLYPSITPVNSFRVILKHYFNCNIEIINDINYFATWDLPFQFNDVTKEVQSP